LHLPFPLKKRKKYTFAVQPFSSFFIMLAFILSFSGKWFLGSVGTGFTPHVIIISAGEVG
jgi:hypothetical protein